jgi:adenylate cyclase
MTDYLILPLVSTDGHVFAVSCTTRRAGGFAHADVSDLESICAPLARLVEIQALRSTAANLLDTYVGHASGGKILQGQIRRGDTQIIRAAILMADLRGFTRLSAEQDATRLIKSLNDFFDCLVPSISDHGGEVLKFLGDGLLAIFSIGGEGADPKLSCEAAIRAVKQARVHLAAQNVVRATASQPHLSFTAGLDYGEVVYGNIGAAGRLDFTAIGVSVNLAARMQTLARDLGWEAVTTQAVAVCCNEVFAPLGSHHLAGFAEPQEVFGLKLLT